MASPRQILVAQTNYARASHESLRARAAEQHAYTQRLVGASVGVVDPIDVSLDIAATKADRELKDASDALDALIDSMPEDLTGDEPMRFVRDQQGRILGRVVNHHRFGYKLELADFGSFKSEKMDPGCAAGRWLDLTNVNRLVREHSKRQGFEVSEIVMDKA